MPSRASSPDARPSGASVSNLPTVSAHHAAKTYARGQLPPAPEPDAPAPKPSNAIPAPMPSVPARLAAAVFSGKAKAKAPPPEAHAPPRADTDPIPSVPARLAAAAFSKKGLAPAPAPSGPPDRSTLPLPSAPARLAQVTFRGSMTTLTRRAAEQQAQRTLEESTARLSAGDVARVPAAGTAVAPDPEGALEPSLDGLVLGMGFHGLESFPPDAAVEAVPTFDPNDGTRAQGVVIGVNGPGQDAFDHAVDLQALADATGHAVIGAHLARGGASWAALTSGDAQPGLTLPGVAGLAEVLVGQLAQGHPVHVVALGVGGRAVAQALTTVTRLAGAEGPLDAETRAQVHAALEGSAIETFACPPTDFPDGLRCVHYLAAKDWGTDAERQALRALMGGRRASLVLLEDVHDGAALASLLSRRVPVDQVSNG